MNANNRIGMDIGGTFTDYVLDSSDDQLRLHKRLTTPQNPAEGALLGLHELLQQNNLALSDIDLIVHGTTLVTNAIIERRGASTALLTTCGFKDILEMGFEQRYDIYDLFLRFPEPLVPRQLRLEVDERMSHDGVPLQEPDLNTVERQVRKLIETGVEALAISFLHAYRNPENEKRVSEHIRATFPDLAVSVSHEVVPEIREFERTNTTVCNAYVQPLMGRYLDRLTLELDREGFGGCFLLMQSSGGSATIETARQFPIRFLESGPAGGTLVTSFIGKALKRPDLLAFDMGGTTAKACLIREGRPEIAQVMEAARVHRFKPGSGLPIKTPVVDMIEIGAGGGSIAHADSLGLLKVGPRSAGADPGPACYGHGGQSPTVTDACLLLGYFDPHYFLGGTMALEVSAAKSAYQKLAQQLGLELQDAAWGVYRVVCENMARATRVHIIEKGQDPRRFALMAFGGAGPAHAARVARIIGASEVIVPRVSGVASALGFLVAPISFEFSRSYPSEVKRLDWEVVQEIYSDLEQQAVGTLMQAGISRESIRLERQVDMRFKGQFHELTVPVPSAKLTDIVASDIVTSFTEKYTQLYHAALPGYEPMVLNWRLRAVSPDVGINLKDTRSASSGTEGALKGERSAYFPEVGGYVNAPVYDRYSLASGVVIPGPALVEERESTTVIGVGDTLRVDELGNLRIQVVKA